MDLRNNSNNSPTSQGITIQFILCQVSLGTFVNFFAMFQWVSTKHLLHQASQFVRCKKAKFFFSDYVFIDQCHMSLYWRTFGASGTMKWLKAMHGA